MSREAERIRRQVMSAQEADGIAREYEALRSLERVVRYLPVTRELPSVESALEALETIRLGIAKSSLK